MRELRDHIITSGDNDLQITVVDEKGVEGKHQK